MPNTPLTNSRIPDSTYATDIASIIHNFAYDVEVNGTPRFTTTSTRDAAYTAWVTAGGTLADGRCCWTDDAGFWDRIGGTWQRRRAGDVGPTSITPVGGWTPITSSSDPGLRYWVRGGWCHVAFHLNGIGSWAGGNTVFTMPAGARPSFTEYVRVTKDNSDGIASGLMSIHTDGTAVINFAGSAGNDIYGASTYPV